ncbi:MAG: type II and III secretion system protein [Chthoniobacterales bacterium]|nr:type II and III secretion system protein [Chthoniobacterales bacterium]
MTQPLNISKIRLRTLVLSIVAIRFIVGVALSPSFAYAQQSGVIGQSEREIRILQERSSWAQTQTQKAITAMADKDYESAFAFSKSAVDALPYGGESSAGLRSLSLETFSKSACALARQRVSEGYYDDAELVVKTATDKPYASSYAPLLDLQKSLRDPNHFNRTITPGFVAKVTQVEQLMNEAEGLYASGRFDAAFNKYQMVLNLDPENRSARLGMEKVNKERSDYAETAYTERRSQMITDVARAWELPVPKINTGATTIVEQSPIDMQGTSAISRKLQEIRLPQLSLSDETVREAVEKLQKKSRVLDTTETDPAKKGVNIVLKLDPAKEAVDGGTKLNLSLNDLPLGEALKYIASAANLKVKIEPYAVAIVPLSEPTETLISKEYKVPPGFISSASASTPTGTLPTAGVPGSSGTVGKAGAKEFLESQGVTFPAGASATYLASSSKLLVKNTQSNLDLIDSLVEVSLATPPSQVEIEARFLEVSQNNLQELGFDWLMGAFQLPGGSGVNTGGGTVGNRQGQANRGNYPFVSPAGQPAGAMAVDPLGNVTAGNVTSGNRTGSAAVTANALDALLFGSPTGPAAGVLALAGIFTNPQFQVVLRAINQQKGVDLVSAPKVTVTSGRKATINITQKFPYPKDYSPPTVVAATTPGQIQPANPATPTSFETRNCGVQLEVEPTVGPDGYTIELSLSPQITEFQGFVNYGSPINSIATVYDAILQNRSIGTQRVFLTANTINQPVFSVRQVDTQVTVYDGQTVVLGGLMREDVQKVQDKTPIVGDLPLVGSLFRSSSNQRIKRNLLIFVSAGLLDPAGQPLIKTVENGTEISIPDARAVASEAIPGDPSTASKSSR